MSDTQAPLSPPQERQALPSPPPEPVLRVLLVGSGAIGTMVAYALEQGRKANVTAVVRSSFELVSTHGFFMDSIDHGEVKAWKPHKIVNQVPDVKEQDLPFYHFIVVSTKNVADVPPSIAEVIAPAVSCPLTAIILIQNGLNIEKPFVEAFPRNPILSGITFMGAKEKPAGHIKHTNKDISLIGPFAVPDALHTLNEAIARIFVDTYNACGVVNCKYDDNVPYSRWKKLLYNASYSSVSTILRMDTSRIRLSEHIVDELIRPVMHEICDLAKVAANVDLDKEELVEGIITADRYTSFFKPSMCQDIEKDNFIEFENIVGEVVREAEKVRFQVPTLKVLYALLKGLQFQVKEAKGLVEVPEEQPEGMKYGDKEKQW